MSENTPITPFDRMIKRRNSDSIGIYDPARVNIFQLAAAETGLGILVQPTNRTRWVSSDKPRELAIELMNPDKKDVSPFWRKVEELEEAAVKKVG